MSGRIAWRAAWIVMAAILLTTACRGNNPEYGVAYTSPTGGDAGRGEALIVSHGCGSCHTIPGIRGANTPDNLVRWVQSPRSIEPTTAMPVLGLTTQQARDVAAYLYTLR